MCLAACWSASDGGRIRYSALSYSCAVALQGWSFESKPSSFQPATIDAQVFWWSLYGVAAVWSLLVVAAVLSLEVFWLLAALIVTGMSSANVIGFGKCDKDAKKRRQVGLGNVIMQ